MTRVELMALLERTATDVAEREISGIEESSVISALGIDSLGMLELVGEIEKKLDIHLPDDDLVGVMTIRDLLDLVEKRRAAA